MTIKIGQLANEEVSFHLHKKRDFIERLDGRYNHNETLNLKSESILKKIKDVYGLSDTNTRKSVMSDKFSINSKKFSLQ